MAAEPPEPGKEGISSADVQSYRNEVVEVGARVQFNLGSLYLERRGVERSGSVALGWFLRATDRGDAEADFNVGT